MQTNDLYRRYLLHDRLAKLVDRAGGEIYSTADAYSGWKPGDLAKFIDATWGATVTVYTTAEAPERNEEIAEALLVALANEPATIKRDGGSLWVLAYLNGEPVRILFGGGGVCEKVVVGHKWVEAQPEQVIPAKEGYAEPIYEYRCPDPIVAAGLTTEV